MRIENAFHVCACERVYLFQLLDICRIIFITEPKTTMESIFVHKCATVRIVLFSIQSIEFCLPTIYFCVFYTWKYLDQYVFIGGLLVSGFQILCATPMDVLNSVEISRIPSRVLSQSI